MSRALIACLLITGAALAVAQTPPPPAGPPPGDAVVEQLRAEYQRLHKETLAVGARREEAMRKTAPPTVQDQIQQDLKAAQQREQEALRRLMAAMQARTARPKQPAQPPAGAPRR